MSARDQLFHYDGRDVVHIRSTAHLRRDPRGARFVPACAARSDKRAHLLAFTPHSWDDLRACVNCARVARQINATLQALRRDT